MLKRHSTLLDKISITSATVGCRSETTQVKNYPEMRHERRRLGGCMWERSVNYRRDVQRQRKPTDKGHHPLRIRKTALGYPTGGSSSPCRRPPISSHSGQEFKTKEYLAEPMGTKLATVYGHWA